MTNPRDVLFFIEDSASDSSDWNSDRDDSSESSVTCDDLEPQPKRVCLSTHVADSSTQEER